MRKSILSSLTALFMTTALVLFGACSDITDSSEINAKSSSAENGRATVSFALASGSGRTIMPTNMQLSDTAQIILSVEKMNEKGVYESFAVEPNWHAETDDAGVIQKSAYEDMISDELTFEYGTYNFTLAIYAYVSSGSSETRLVQTAELKNVEINQKTETLEFEAKYVDSGVLSIKLQWDELEYHSPIGRVVAALYKVTERGTIGELVEGTEQTIKAPMTEEITIGKTVKEVYTATYSLDKEIPNGSYWVKFQLYGSEIETLDKILNTITDIVKIKGYKTQKTLELDIKNLNYLYTVNLVLDGGNLVDENAKEIIKRNSCESYTLPTAEEIELEGYIFAGWTEVDSDDVVVNEDKEGNPILTTEIAGDPETTARSYIFKALWNPITYTIAFNPNNESSTEEMESITATYDEPITLPANIYTRTGYSFGGWAIDDKAETGKYHDEEKIDENLTTTDGETVTLYAIWNEHGKHTVYYKNTDGNNENLSESVQFAEANDFTLPTLTKTGYIFGGWYTDEDFADGTEIAGWEAGNKTDNVTVYAKWTPITYTIKFDANNEKATGTMEPITATYDVDVTLPENGFTLLGYNFAGWAFEKDVTEIYYGDEAEDSNLTDENGATITLYAVWTAKDKLTLYYQNFDGINEELAESVEFAENEDITLPTVTKTGYIFDGWYENVGEEENPAGNKITGWKAGDKTEDVYVYAEWTPISYTIKFDANNEDATGTMEPLSLNYDQDSYLPENGFTLLGYKLSGWAIEEGSNEIKYDDLGEVTKPTTNGATITLYAVWTPKDKLKLYYANIEGINETLAEYVEFAENEPVTLPTVTKNGYTFDGWYDNYENDQPTGNKITGWSAGEKTEDFYVYAKWTLVTYEITYELDGGTNNEDNPTEYNVEQAISLAEPSRTGYIFGGWYPDVSRAEGTDITRWSAGDKTENITVYAKWTPISYTIAFEGNNEDPTQTMVSITATYDESVTLPKNAFTYTGHVFNGWALESGAETVEYADNAKISENLTDENGTTITLYAVWTAIEINPITVNMEKFTIPDGIELSYDENTKTFTIAGEYSVYAWAVDGVTVSGATSSTFTVDEADFAAGNHTLLVTVKTTDGNPLSATGNFTITK